MMWRIGVLAAALLVAGCGGKDEAANVDKPMPEAGPLPVTPEYQDAPNIDTMLLSDASTYCAFFPMDHEFVFDDPETWEFVFVTVFGEADSSDAYDGMVSLNGQIRTVELITQDVTETGEVRTYRTKTAPVAVLKVEMVAGDEGIESTGYTGTIAVTLPEGGAAVAFDGDCGV